MTLLQALILGIVEGVTEFLPVSSTAHLIFASHLMGLAQTPFLASFEIAIQLGAIAAVAAVLVKRVLAKPRLILIGIAGFIPTGIIGAFAYPYVKELLNASPLTPIVALGVGGAFLIAFEWLQKRNDARGKHEAGYAQSVITGFAQALAFIPGVSRSAASVVGGMFAGLDRKAAVELSFLLAIPTMIAATGLDVMKSGFAFSGQEWGMLAAGLIASFVTALVVVRWFLKYVQTHTFTWFGVYRIIAALVLAAVLL